MSAADRQVWFVGDLEDPWVASLADVLPPGTRQFPAPGGLPDDWPGNGAFAAGAPRAVVMHRSILSAQDAERLARLRGRFSASASPGAGSPAPRVILCVGPYVRHADLERWSARGVIDAILPEATARDTIGRHLAAAADAAPRRSPGPRPTVAVVSANFELRRTLADACEALGFPPEPACEWSEAPATGPAVWDVPVLEPEWPRALARRARKGAVVVLLGFADRTTVGQARAQGASACLELPYDLLDLEHVLDRVTAPRGEPAHAVPPPPASSRRRSPVAGPGPRA
jgi:hypothetical protein